jgi:hypothetical protein
MIGAPLYGAIREELQRLLAECQVNIRLTPLLEALRNKRNLEFSP